MITHLADFGIGLIVGMFICLLVISLMIKYKEK
ncbi:hypothetical protein SAMN04515679_2881 [Pelosinus fermentans]|uniref:Uncharacterized protein n=1 Tax=Pelosinus fermentans B4 TaxID=1149862 RepID=I9LC21_9FIRM|nr:hypothetical protein FB4_3904 [Pelosinus fermentans B4]EIW23823.1 hypothetical protein FA11_3906 [Pelosinus fermentans A11]OAM94746.1 hypothetical protein FR7_02766 [Pelosinus fermentans DSM 17108]SDR16647.1 hypothetical protein SAMN04515679_2881 [Pelosinus fermentans]